MSKSRTSDTTKTVKRARKSEASATANRSVVSKDPQTAFASLLTPAESRDYIQVAVTLPRSHMRVLTTEANLFGLRRAQFLEFLLLNQKGQKVLHRLPGAPNYEFTRAELTETERFLWVMHPEVKKAFEEHIVRFGLKPSAWVITSLNEWAAITGDSK